MKSILRRSFRRHHLYKSAPVLALVAWFGFFPSCATAPVGEPLPTSEWGDSYNYSVDLSGLPARPAASVPINVAVVNPSYKEDESSLVNPLYSKIGRGFAGSMGADLDKVLIAKGMTTTGPFSSLDEITYSQKKDAVLTLAPHVFITAEIKYAGGSAAPALLRSGMMTMPGAPLGGDQGTPTLRSVGMTMDKTFVMHVSGWVSFVMQEPLSGEKMWIKRLELDTVEVSGLEVYRAAPIMQGSGCGGQAVVGYNNSGVLLYDGKTDAMASALKQIYPIVIRQFQKYLDADEMVALKAKVEEIRKAKVY
jgi:hypothetical protein